MVQGSLLCDRVLCVTRMIHQVHKLYKLFRYTICINATPVNVRNFSQVSKHQNIVGFLCVFFYNNFEALLVRLCFNLDTIQIHKYSNIYAAFFLNKILIIQIFDHYFYTHCCYAECNIIFDIEK